MADEIKRLIAFHVPIELIIKSRFVKSEEELSPSYLVYNEKNISRVNVIGIVVSVENENEFMIDDGTGKVPVRSFEQQKTAVNIGDVVNVIGRPREYNNERYIMPEIIKKSDEKWMRIRKEEIKRNGMGIIEESKEETGEEEYVEENVEKILDTHDAIIDFIKSRDKGEGVDVEGIIKECRIDNCDKVIESMLKEGEIFENKPGRIKVLE